MKNIWKYLCADGIGCNDISFGGNLAVSLIFLMPLFWIFKLVKSGYFLRMSMTVLVS